MLDRDEVRFDERKMVNILVLEHLDNSGVVDPRRHDRQQVIDEKRCLREVEGEGLPKSHLRLK